MALTLVLALVCLVVQVSKSAREGSVEQSAAAGLTERCAQQAAWMQCAYLTVLLLVWVLQLFLAWAREPHATLDVVSALFSALVLALFSALLSALFSALVSV